MKSILRAICLPILTLMGSLLPVQAATTIKNLQVEYQANPLGIDIEQPRFNWQMQSERYGAMQTAYRLLMADSPEALSAWQNMVGVPRLTMKGKAGRYANYIPVVGTPPHGILEQHYASMTAYMNYLERTAVNYVQPSGGFGDWLAIEETNSMLTNTAYSAYDALIMEQVAGILGKESDAKRFRTFYSHVKEAFNKYFVDEEGYTYKATIPANTTAVLILPVDDPKKVKITKGKEATRYRGTPENKVTYTLQSGSYEFTFNN